MLDYNLINFVVIAAVLLCAGVVFALRGGQPFPPRLIILAIGLRVVGSFVRYEVLMRAYNGVADSVVYYSRGLDFAERLRNLDLSVLGFAQWFGDGKWWGTQFVENISGLVLTLIGPTMRGEFLVFSMIGFAGLYLAARALLEMSPRPVVARYATWIWLWPSLWFWPSSVGKEAIIIFATGLFFFGYVGRAGRIRWGFYVAGTLLAFAIRPHYAAFLIMATGMAHWLGSWKGSTPKQLSELAIVVLIAVLALYGMTALFGIERADFEGMQEFLIVRGQGTLTGGSNLGGLPSGVSGAPKAFINIWMRPFPWEVHNLTSLVTTLELMALWVLIWRQRRSVLSTFKHWRNHHVWRFATIAVIGYTLLIGYTFGNLGIIARQRTPMFIFLFMILVAAPYPVLARAGTARAKGRFFWSVPQRDPQPAFRNARLPSRVREAGLLPTRGRES